MRYCQFSMILEVGQICVNQTTKSWDMQFAHFICTQFQNFWHIMRFSINKHRQVIKAQISMLNPCVTVKFSRILGWWIFMQIRQRVFKCFTMQIWRLFFTVFWNFWRITHLSTSNHHWIINAQTGPFFLAHPICITIVCCCCCRYCIIKSYPDFNCTVKTAKTATCINADGDGLRAIHNMRMAMHNPTQTAQCGETDWDAILVVKANNVAVTECCSLL